MTCEMNRRAIVAALLGSCGAAFGADWNNAAGGSWNDPANWTPMNVPNVIGEDATISLRGSYIITNPSSSNPSFDTLTLSNPDVDLLIDIASSMTLGAFAHTNNGEILIGNFSASGSNSILDVGGSVSGTGFIRLQDPSSDDAQLNGDFTNGANHTITGTGLFSAGVVNNGTVLANVAGFAMTLQGPTKVNNATMGAELGGILGINGITIDQTGGGSLIADGADSLIRFTSGFNSTVLGGTLETANGAPPIRRLSGATLLDSVTLDGDLIIDVSGTVNVDGTGITNNGTIDVGFFSASGGNHIINLMPGTTLSGDGLLSLNDPSADDAQLVGVFTHAATHTIAGTGIISATVINDGEVWADVDGSPLTLQNGLKTNNNLMGAVGGGIMAVSSITIDQTGGGSLIADGETSEVRFNAGNNSAVIGGTLESVNGGLFRRQSAITTLQDVTNNADLLVDVSGTINVMGAGLTNNGTIDLGFFSGSSGNHVIDFAPGSLLDGSGLISLNDSTADDAQVNGEVTQADAHTIAGTGNINALLTNDGEVWANNPDGQSLRLQTADKVNNNVMGATGGGVLNIAGITIDQTQAGDGASPAIIADGEGSQVIFTGGTNSTILSGELNALNGAEPFLRQSGVTTLQNVALNADLLVDISGTIEVTGGGLVNNGTIDLGFFSGSVGNHIINFAPASQLDGSGVIRLNDGSADDAQVNGDLTQASTHTIAGAGNINAALTNDGHVIADTTQVLRLQGADKVNNNLITAVNDAVIEVHGVTIDQSGGGVMLADGADSLIRFQSGTGSVIIGGELNAANGGSYVRESAGTTLVGVTLNAPLEIGISGTIVVEDSLENNGLIEVGTFSGSVGNHIISFTDPITITGTGEIALQDPSADDAQLNGSVITNGPEHTISGDGNINASIINQGELAPGIPTGSLPLLGDYTQTETGAFRVTLAGLSDFSQLAVTGTAGVDGGTIVEVDPEFVPPIGSEYEILTAASVTGDMPVIAAPQIGRLIFVTISDPDQVRLFVTYCADLNDDDVIDSQDLNIILANFGTGDGGDINGDGMTNSQDLNLLLAVFGTVCD